MRPFARSIRLAGVLLALVLGARCGSSTSTSTAPTSIPRCGITLNSSAMSVPASGGSGAVSVTATRDCAWSASVEGNWISVRNGANGQGEGIVEFAAAANPDPQTRTGAIVVNNSRAQITQAAADCVITLATASAELPPDGGTARIDVQASSQLCAWTASADAPWIQFASSPTGRGSGPVTISVAATTGPPRAGSVTIAGQRFSVTQSEGCKYAIDRTSQNTSSNGGAGTVAIKTDASCPWTAASNVDWITVSPATGSGPAPVTFNVARTSGPQRTGTAVIAGQLFTIVQSAGCTFQVSPAAHAIGAGGGTAAVDVSTSTGCTWTAASGAEWIAIQGPASGNGSGSVTFSVAPTTGPARNGTLTVAGQQISIAQSQGCTYAISPQSQSVPAAGGSGKVAVTAGPGCAWTASSGATWATIASGTSGNGNGEVQFNVAATTGPSRSTTLTIAGQTFTINQGAGCTFNLSPSRIDVSDNGGQRTFDVQTANGCGWTAASNAPWITINSGASGSGTGTVRFTVAANTGPGRTGTITAGDQTFTVVQGTGCVFTLSPTSVDVPSGGGQRTFDVQTGSGCGWTASATNTPWITIDSGASGSGGGPVRFTAAANSGAARTGTITAGGQNFTVRQASGCTFALSADRHTAPPEGGTGTVNVTAASGCDWTASTNAAPWLTITSGASGSGNGPVGFSIAANTGAARSGTLTIAGRTFTVDQASGCTYSISPAAQTVPAAGGGVTVNVTAAGSCTWTAASNANWIGVTSGTSGTGGGPVQMTVAANTGAARSGTVTIAGHTFTVNQESGCTASVTPTTITAPAAAGTSRVDVTAPAGCGWTATSNAGWITVTSGAAGNGNGPVDLAFAANTGPARSGTALIAGQTVTVDQQSGCTVAITPSSQSVPAVGGAGGIAVSAPGGCQWTAVSSATWVVVILGASGSGDGAVAFTVDPNLTGAARSATITIGNQTFTVNQQ